MHALFLALLACDGLDLPSEGTLDRTRILAARSEPAQPVAGEAFTVTSRAWAPSGTPIVVWCWLGAQCDPWDSLVVALSGLDWAALAEADRQARRTQAQKAGILGVEPGMPVAAIAAPLPTGQVVLLAHGVPLEGDDVEQATLTLTLATDVPNRHPTIDAVRVDGEAVDQVVVSVDQTVVLDVGLSDDSLETYVSEDGRSQTEQAEVRWYTDAPDPSPTGFGGGDGPAFVDDGTRELTVDRPFEGIVVVVVRDGRGGVDWRQLTLTVQ